MKQFDAKSTQQYISRLGVLLSAAVVNQQTAAEQRAVAILGDHIATARSYHGWSRANLAKKLDMAEVDVQALEQGLLPYAELQEPFLRQLAIAIEEDVTVLRALLVVVDRTLQPVALATQQTVSTIEPVSKALLTAYKSDEKLQRASTPWTRLYAMGTQRLLHAYRRCLHWVAALGYSPRQRVADCRTKAGRGVHVNELFYRYRSPVTPFRFGALSMAVLCCFFVLPLVAFLFAPGMFPAQSTRQPVEIAASVQQQISGKQLAAAAAPSPTTSVMESDQPVADKILPTADRATVGVVAPSARDSNSNRHHYRIIYITDGLNNVEAHLSQFSPLIPVSGGRVAMIDLMDELPKILLRCRVVGHLDSCPM